jgi:hypothetical protein
MRKRLLGTLTAVLLTATLGSAAPITEPPECVLAEQWVRAHADALPTTLAGLSGFSTTYRRAIHNALPRETRVSLWREHMGSFLAPESELNDEQRAAVREVIARLPALHAEGADPAERHALMAHLKTIFPRELGARIFNRLGAPTTAAKGANAVPGCNCTFDETFDECRGGTCTNNVCVLTSSGCGLSGLDGCYGVCWG